MTTTHEQESVGPATEDVQQVIAGFGESVPSEVWEALEAVKPFLDQRQMPQFTTSMTGTIGVFQR